MNLDLTFFTKILAARLLPYIVDVVNLDQVDFISSREARDNMTKALAIVHVASSGHSPLMLLSMNNVLNLYGLINPIDSHSRFADYQKCMVGGFLICSLLSEGMPSNLLS